MSDKDLKRNAEGYLDLTAYEALRHVDEEERLRRVIHIIYKVCELAGFEIVNRIALKDKESGEIWR